MTAQHFFADDVAGESIVLTGEEARHAVRVLRIAPGEIITVSDGRGAVVEAIVADAGAELIAEVRARRTEAPPSPSLHVFQAIPKAGKLDLVVQKLTELGADVVTPFRAERSVARWDARKSAEQARRLATIAREAAKQSRRAWLMEVRPPTALPHMGLPETTFVLDEGTSARLRDRLPEEPPVTIGLVVGPEGGLTEEEVSSLAGRGAIPVSLGPLILRTETAALAAAVVLLGRYARIG